LGQKNLELLLKKTPVDYGKLDTKSLSEKISTENRLCNERVRHDVPGITQIARKYWGALADSTAELYDDSRPLEDQTTVPNESETSNLIEYAKIKTSCQKALIDVMRHNVPTMLLDYIGTFSQFNIGSTVMSFQAGLTYGEINKRRKEMLLKYTADTRNLARLAQTNSESSLAEAKKIVADADAKLATLKREYGLLVSNRKSKGFVNCRMIAEFEICTR